MAEGMEGSGGRVGSYTIYDVRCTIIVHGVMALDPGQAYAVSSQELVFRVGV
jgi:hypothetical protein